MLFKELVAKLQEKCRKPLEIEIVARKGKARHNKDDKDINTFQFRVASNPPRVLYRKNLRTEPATFLDSTVPAVVLQDIQRKLGAM